VCVSHTITRSAHARSHDITSKLVVYSRPSIVSKGNFSGTTSTWIHNGRMYLVKTRRATRASRLQPTFQRQRTNFTKTTGIMCVQLD